MQNTFITIVLAFIEGLGLIASPCILPILPIVLSTSISGSRTRPYGIILGFVIVFALFTFFSRKLVQLSGIDLNWVRYASFALLLLLGIIMMSSFLSEKFSLLTQRLASIGASANHQTDGGFLSGISIGGLIALIWTPCAGPILAAVIVQTVLQTSTLNSFFVMLAFGLGAGIPMLLIASFGRAIMERLKFFKQHAELLRKILGLIIILSVGFMIYNEGYTGATFTTQNTNVKQTALINGITPQPAPDFAGITDWINSSPLTMAQLKGKVVLIDFWTYSCINCLRTLPYIKNWYNKYHDKGLVIIGVHTPEFEFEKNLNNVKTAVAKFGIRYPVALDSNYGTWQNYNNQYWPAHYLINKDGQVVYQHFGEGEYDVTENNIRFLLGLSEVNSDTSHSEDLSETFTKLTPETYLGYARADSFARPDNIVRNNVGSYTFPETLDENMWGLDGKWIVNNENIISAAANASIKIRFHAKHVYVVMGNKTGKPIHVKLKLNGEAVINEKGKDVTNSQLTVTDNALYEALSFNQSSNGILELTSDAPGLELYTFTFGS